jgi:flagellar assembly protein FliH
MKGRTIELYRYSEASWDEGGVGFAEAYPASSDIETQGGEWSYPKTGDGAAVREPLSGVQSASDEEWAHRLAEASRYAEERGRSGGLEAGILRGREEVLKQLGLERDQERDRLHAQAAALLQSFAEERDQAVHRLEQEAVRLALAIAARILRREAQMDPLLLTGAVRVALGQLAQSTVVRLRVPTQDQAMWEEALARMPGLPLRPVVIGDAGMRLGECRMETELGSADLGLWAQLKEIERGFFDRVGGRGPEPNLNAEGRSDAPSGEPVFEKDREVAR